MLLGSERPAGAAPCYNRASTANNQQEEKEWATRAATTLEEVSDALHVQAMSAVVDALIARCASRDLVPVATSVHTLRHTFATSYLRDYPGDLVGLAALLGHSTLETTRIYVQPTGEGLAARVEATRLNAYD